MSPFIVTTRRPGSAEFYPDPADNTVVLGFTGSCRAVATLEEAREMCLTPEQAASARDLMAALKVSLAVTGSGGSVVRPDGTVIDVVPVTWERLTVDAGLEPWHLTTPPRSEIAARILATYNARKAGS